ncbi:MAG: hypothetical protein OXG92_08675 [Chloroflexi bacterium]|nr:hypothetical protein [Chloroflexota bacterium]MCY3582018.1 hypothetical protein [Chloroflexota bacterium]MCY3716523.1 hypothetical protein [Chloroflexota bacterium]MDE2651632.1 hypothetical protein [Chloroflexota bacterium]MXV92708.1 hypothetical protein [Chloroflexota bacterium]
MPIPRLPTLLAAAVGFLLVGVVGALLLSPPLPLILSAGFDRAAISPNADGDNDIALFEYALARPATISLSLEAESGRVFFFRERQARGEGEYSVQFSGVVDGFLLEGESAAGRIERRLIPNGRYTWHLQASAAGEEAREQGSLLIEDGDTPLPVMSEFAIAPTIFSPNQDGVADRVSINVYLLKDVARLDIFLLGPDNARIPISARVEERAYGEAGRHRYDYEGGIDLGVDPPPDGSYTVVALAQDHVGQRIRRQGQLTIELGGKPYAEIVPQSPGVDVAFAVQPSNERYLSSAAGLGEPLLVPDDSASFARSQQITTPIDSLLVFRLTVENYGDVPIRTSGPPPGTVYRQDQLAGSLDFFDESGAWRVGIQCETSTSSFPWRWAIAPDAALTEVFDEASGNTYRYLPAGARAVVWGGIQLTQVAARNPQNCWAGLIHEDVAISLRNNHVGLRSIMIADPTEDPES